MTEPQPSQEIADSEIMTAMETASEPIPKLKATVIDDDFEIADLIRDRINETEVAVCEDVYSGPNAYLRQESRYDVVLLDVFMPDMNGLDAISLILEKHPETMIIMNTITNDPETIFKAIKSGAVGYLDKQSTQVDYTQVLTAVRDGGAYVTPAIAHRIVAFFQTDDPLRESLTKREYEVANAIVEGLSYKDIAEQLDLSINTVRMHIKNIYRKLQINSKIELYRKFKR